MLSRTPEHLRESAWNFIRFMLSPESNAYYAERSGFPAFAIGPHYQSSGSPPDSHKEILDEALPYLRGDFSVTMSPAVRNAFDEAFQKIMVNLADVRTALDEADLKAEAGVRAEIGPR